MGASDTFSPSPSGLTIKVMPNFSDAQQARLQELKGRRQTLTPAKYAELEGLVEASLDATMSRAQTIKTTDFNPWPLLISKDQ